MAASRPSSLETLAPADPAVTAAVTLRRTVLPKGVAARDGRACCVGLACWLLWFRIGANLEPDVPISLSIKNVPDEMVRRLRKRAESHHRSLQGELMAILEEAAGRSGRLTPHEVLAEVRQLRLKTPRGAARMIREDRDGR
jgi:plasmid stability protein